MEFDYQTRKKYAEKCISEWENRHPLKRKLLSAELKALMPDIQTLCSSYNQSTNQLDQFLQTHKGEATPSAFMKKHCNPLVELYVPKEYLEDYYAIIDRFPDFQYTTGVCRRTLRTKNPEVHMIHAFRLLYSYMVFASYHTTVTDYLTDKLPPEALDFKRHDNYYNSLHLAGFDDILAARINAGDTQVIETVREAFLSENNTVIITSDIIRAVLKSDAKDLHELLAKFLVAARLQEGVRQVICENADCGLADAFLTILDAISRENLIRFAAVKRAIATWTGICDTENMERITDKVFADIQAAVRDTETARQMTASNDSVHIMIGLWALGFYEVEDALAEMRRLAQNGTRNQLLTISYYNRAVQDRKLIRRTATQIFEQYPEDYELLAAFMPTYIEHADHYARESAKPKDGRWHYGDDNVEYVYKTVPITYLFDSEEQARKHYEILKHASQNMKKRKQEFSPCIFPWYSVVLEKSDFIIRMALIAYSLADQSLIDEVCQMLSDISGAYISRRTYIRMLLHDPKTQIQRQALISYIADKETYTRATAYAILSDMTLSDAEYEQLEGYLKYKTEAIRQFVLKLLTKRSEDDLQKSVKRLLASKQENMRLAGLDIVKTKCEQHPEKREQYAALVQSGTADSEAFSEQEKLLLGEITGNGGAGDILNKEGYGLYDPKVVIQLPEQPINQKAFTDFFSLSKKELDTLFIQLTAFIDAHAKDEYVNAEGETRLLGNGLEMIARKYKLPVNEQYPFPELWKEFYDTYIKTPKNFWNMYLAMASSSVRELKDASGFLAAEKEVFGACGSSYEIPDKKYLAVGQYKRNMLSTILSIIRCQQDPELPREAAVQACLYAAALPENRKWYEKTERKYAWEDKTPYAFTGSGRFAYLTGRINEWKDDSEFAETFYTLYRLDETYRFREVHKKHSNRYHGSSQYNYLSMYSYIKAYTLGLIPADLVYRNAFETLGLSFSVLQLNCFMKEKPYVRELQELKKYMSVDLEQRTVDTDSEFYRTGKEFYKKIVNTILNVELKRGDSATVFSGAVRQISCVYGLDRFMEILTALGKDTLDRSAYYYYGSGTGKRECLSHLLQVCYPLAEDTAEKLAEKMKQHKISKDRLIEAAMYAPQWLDMAEEYLNCDGFKSGCYYFMAHMNERFDDKKKAIIAKYTPLTPEELNDGCFDLDWFFEAYEKLGEDMFSKLYKSAKYISDGNKHARARKYADAALGKVTRGDLEQTISDKRNKDLLMSYGILPIADEADELHRYEFLQKFLKESKQFGAQRRASEAKCVEVALKNLATTAGYADDLRLTLAMETALVTSNAAYFEGTTIGGYECRITVNTQGKAELCISKEGKTLKSVPAAIKKDEAYLAIREFTTKLKNQYSRCVQMFERAMEEREYYTFGEIQKLCRNPVTRAILNNLVFVIPDIEKEISAGYTDMREKTSAENAPAVQIGILTENADGMTDAKGGAISLTADRKLRVAHPYDLYQAGCWAEYQKLFFTRQQETGRKQPFKQVFRELYVKLPEEAQADKSRMFAGNQIQPAKTVGALKSRRWVADYENGLQKIYYKENIIATIYAMADWFSPADTEEPTLEYVVFYDRKTFRQMKLSEVPDIVYSEVMRDTDLAVSVAHAGGVDPLTSHSTIEMRKVIVQFNLELFQLDNVTLEGTHAFVKGKYAEYSIHLGSGVIHQVGGHQINVLPVHSQNRGKIFLPFIDDDPKTAEIMAKVLLFAQDTKIKDPYIMEQIVR